MSPEATQALHQAANNVLVWIGFGMLAGLIAKAIMPGRDPGGPIVTLLLGCGGSVIGSGTLLFFFPSYQGRALSALGFAIATGGAFILLFFYRLLAGRIIREDGEGHGGINRVGQSYYRRRRRTVYED